MPQTFDEDFYLANNPDVANAVSAGLFDSGEQHWLLFGQAEGRPGNSSSSNGLPGFNPLYYLESNPDVADAANQGLIVSALAHYMAHGKGEGRDPNPEFDETAYLDDNPDVTAAVEGGAVGSGYEHYLATGKDEGRDTQAAGTDGKGPMGITIVVGTEGPDFLDLGNGKQAAFGLGEDDVLIGGNGKDTLDGGTGDDTIDGSNGKDILFGDTGSNLLTGGNGPDTFLYIVPRTDVNDMDPEPAKAGAVYDQITDFGTGPDVVEFQGEGIVVSDQEIAVMAAVAGLDPAATIAEIQGAMVEANTTDDALAYAMLGSNTYILFEADGASDTFDPETDVFIQLTGVATNFNFASDVVINDMII